MPLSRPNSPRIASWSDESGLLSSDGLSRCCQKSADGLSRGPFSVIGSHFYRDSIVAHTVYGNQKSFIELVV